MKIPTFSASERNHAISRERLHSCPADTAVDGPIAIASYPGETATLDGTNLPIPNGQNALVTLTNISSVIIQAFEHRNYTTASRAHVPVRIYVTGAGSFVQLIGNLQRPTPHNADRTRSVLRSMATGRGCATGKERRR